MPDPESGLTPEDASTTKVEFNPAVFFWTSGALLTLAVSWWIYDQIQGAYTTIDTSTNASMIRQIEGLTATNDYEGVVLDLDARHWIAHPKEVCTESFGIGEDSKMHACKAALDGMDGFASFAEMSGPSALLKHETFSPEEITTILDHLETKRRYTLPELQEDATKVAYGLGSLALVAGIGWTGRQAWKLREEKRQRKLEKRLQKVEQASSQTTKSPVPITKPATSVLTTEDTAVMLNVPTTASPRALELISHMKNSVTQKLEEEMRASSNETLATQITVAMLRVQRYQKIAGLILAGDLLHASDLIKSGQLSVKDLTPEVDRLPRRKK